jgi:hypothetical protein
MSQDGFQNETIISNYLDGQNFFELNENWKKALKNMFGEYINDNELISCTKKGGQDKTDLVIKCKNVSHSLSLKKGNGNSIHQEPLEEFIKFLKKNYDIEEKLADDFRMFIWGDGTLNGSGKVSDRLSASQLKKEYPEVVLNIKKFFHENKGDLIERFLIKGPKSKNNPEFIYYGTSQEGICKSSTDVLNWLCNDRNESKNAVIPVGGLTFQAWNRNINGGNKSEHKRGVIQLKWGSIGQDLELIPST